VDEWNVWYQTPTEQFERSDEPFVEAPPLIEDTYTVTDALVVGCVLITLLRHADRVRMACLAQLVNVIAPIRSGSRGGPAWRQTTYFPFQHASAYGRGTVLRVEPQAPTYATEGEKAVSVLEATAVHDGNQALTVFAVNRAAEPLGLRCLLQRLGAPELVEHLILDGDPEAANTADDPDRVAPRRGDGARVAAGELHAELPPRSWNVLRLRGAA
jgi:alpha-L-arabinofuranosidase